MENLKKQLNENQTFSNMFIAFVTFFLMIVAIMSNSIVSASSGYTVTIDGKEHTYKYYTSYINYNSDKTKQYKFCLFYNDYDGFKINSCSYLPTINGNVIKSINDGYYICYESSIDSNEFKTVSYQWHDYSEDGRNNNAIDILVTSDKEAIKGLVSNDPKIIDHWEKCGQTVEKKTQPTVTPELVKEIPTGMTKTMKTLIPVGLVIFGAILGTYLLKRLVAYFL